MNEGKLVRALRLNGEQISQMLIRFFTAYMLVCGMCGCAGKTDLFRVNIYLVDPESAPKSVARNGFPKDPVERVFHKDMSMSCLSSEYNSRTKYLILRLRMVNGGMESYRLLLQSVRLYREDLPMHPYSSTGEPLIFDYAHQWSGIYDAKAVEPLENFTKVEIIPDDATYLDLGPNELKLLSMRVRGPRLEKAALTLSILDVADGKQLNSVIQLERSETVRPFRY